jgi:hypothetical protein
MAQKDEVIDQKTIGHDILLIYLCWHTIGTLID